jgi:hypothetical protein
MTWAQACVTAAVRRALVDLECSQADFSAEIGLSTHEARSRLTGRTRWTLDDAVAVAAWLRVPLADLVSGKALPRTPGPSE